MIDSFIGKPTKILVNGRQVYPGSMSTKVQPGELMVVQIEYQVTPIGNIGVLDYWTVGVTVSCGGMRGWNSTMQRGPGVKTGMLQVGDLRAPTSQSPISCTIWAIDEVNPTEPPQ